MQILVLRAALAVAQAQEDVVQTFDGVDDGSGETPSFPPIVAIGPATGDVSATSVVVWARSSGPARLSVEVDADPSFHTPTVGESVVVGPATDFAAQLPVRGLVPDTRYSYRVWAEPVDPQSVPERSAYATGEFRTAPLDASRPIGFVFSGDLGGAGYCRLADDGYRIFDAMASLTPSFFVATGDMIYADNTCSTNRPRGGKNVPGRFRGVDSPLINWLDSDQLRATYSAHWRYNRSDPHFQEMLRHVPMYAMWDDHEVINDFGASWGSWLPGDDRAGYANLVQVAREAFFSYAPLARSLGEPNRIYRSFSWGPDLDLFLLDTRSYRSRNDLPDSPENQKTMLGAQQLAWLEQGVIQSRATWKVVCSSGPLSVATGGLATRLLGSDSWANGVMEPDPTATGFEHELLELLGSFDAAGVRNLVFLTGDIHQSLAVRYEVDLNGDQQPLRFHEFVAGPLSAEPGASPPKLDGTLHPTFIYGRGGQGSFGFVRITPQAEGPTLLAVDFRGVEGQPFPGSEVVLRPE